MQKKLSFILGLIFFIFNYTFSFSQQKDSRFSQLDKSKIKTGHLYNKVKVPISKIHYCNGINEINTINHKQWRDIYSDIYFSSLSNYLSDYQKIKTSVKSKIRQNIFPVGIINFSYNEFKKDALKDGLIEIKNNKVYAKKDGIYIINHVFSTSVIDTKQYTGLNPTFDFSEEYYFTNSKKNISYFEVDFSDGNSFKKVNINDKIKINYKSEGAKIVIVKAIFTDNSSYKAKFTIKISSPKMPTPSETWTNYTADEAYSGTYAQGEVGVFLGTGNSDFTRPVIIVDGFDPGDTRNIAGLWDIANQQNMVDNLTAEGYDFVIVNFYGGDDYIQRNAMLVKKVIQEINARMISAGTMKDANQIAVIGPSMGGLITRYAIRNMEINGINHNVRNWISFDSPMKGANIPLGLQHWVRFFADEADIQGAIEAKVALSGPAAKQMLTYHYTATSGNTANSNGLYNSFYNEFNAMGFPQQTRIVSIANGSGYSQNQGFNPGNKVVAYRYRSFLVDLDGDVWAVPNQTYTRIFEGLYNPIGWTNESENIYVNNTLPYDGAPGGKRNTFYELGETDTDGYGDIIAIHNDHSFIPTISAMCVQNTVDPYYHINNNINTLTTPFHKLYYPLENQEHVEITPESYAWFYHEVINFAPQFTSIPITTINEDAIYSYTLSATDENEWNVLTYELIEKPDWLIFNETTGEFSGTPLNENVGANNISVKVKDELDETIQSFIINVTNTNDAPVITSTAIETATEDVEYTYTITATDEDPIPDVLTFLEVNIPNWLSFDGATKILSGTPLNEHVGTHNITLRVNDGTVDVDQIFTITVNNVNDAPVITSTAIETATEDVEYTYTITATDEDPTLDMLTFSEINIPNWLSFDGATKILSGTPLNEHVGIHDITLRVNDGTVDVDQIFTITVSNVNDSPVITSTAIETASEDVEYTYTITATDEDPTLDILTFSEINIPNWLSFDGATKILSGTPLNEHVGIHDITLRVNDGTVDVDQIFTITVNNVNDAPTLENNLINQYTTETEEFTYTFAENTFNDVDFNDVLTYSATLEDDSVLPVWLNFNYLTRTFLGTLVSDEDYIIKVTATDNSFETIFDTFELNVAEYVSIHDNETIFEIYPNPASDIVIIKLGKSFSKIEIFNIQGKVVKSISGNKNKTLEVDISNLAQGLYLINITSGMNIYSQKIIIE